MGNTATLVCDLGRNRWGQDSRGLEALYHEGTHGDFLAGGEGGDVFVLEDGIVDGTDTFTLKYISRFDDQGAPENVKTYQDLVVTHDTQGATLYVALLLDNGDRVVAVGSFSSDGRTETVIPLPPETGGDVEQGARGQNCAVYVYGEATNPSIAPIVLYGLNLHYFVEPRYTMVWDSDEQDFGAREVKAVRALEFDLENASAVTVALWSDLPGNVTIVRVEKSIPAGTGRRPFQVPIPEYVEGRHIRVQVYSEDKAFLLWGGRILLQPYGTYIEAYEGAAGQRWDSFQVDFGDPSMKMARELDLDCDTDAPIAVELLSDYPGNSMQVRKSTRVDTEETTTGRRMVHIPLERPAHPQYLEGRLWQLRLTGGSALRLFGARMEIKPYGELVEGYQSAAGRTWSSDVLDLGSPRVKEIREVQLDIDTAGPMTLRVWTELPGLGLAVRVSKTVNTEPTTTGRRMVNIPLTADGSPIEGRMVRLELIGSSEFRLFGAWVFARAIGYYVEAYQAQEGHIWDSTILDLGTPNVKRLLQVYFEAHVDSAPLTVRVYTSNANDDMTLRDEATLPASVGRKPYIVPLEGVYGRLARVTASSLGAFRLFVARVQIKPIGVYLNAASEEVFPVEAEQDVGTERVKLFKEIEVVYSGVGTLEFATDPLGTTEIVATFPLTSTAATKTVKLRLFGNTKGRLVRCIFRPGSSDLAVFSCRVWARTVGEGGMALWSWITLPIPATPDNYQPVELYVAPTPPAWDWAEIFVPKTPLDWRWVAFPVERTAELPVWHRLPVADLPARLPMAA